MVWVSGLYINDRQPHYLLCASITPPEDELQQQFRKIVTKNPCPDEAFYFQIFYSGCPSTRLFEIQRCCPHTGNGEFSWCWSSNQSGLVGEDHEYYLVSATGARSHVGVIYLLP